MLRVLNEPEAVALAKCQSPVQSFDRVTGLLHGPVARSLCWSSQPLDSLHGQLDLASILAYNVRDRGPRLYNTMLRHELDRLFKQLNPLHD